MCTLSYAAFLKFTAFTFYSSSCSFLEAYFYLDGGILFYPFYLDLTVYNPAILIGLASETLKVEFKLVLRVVPFHFILSVMAIFLSGSNGAILISLKHFMRIA
jgi:hypothetical protein